MVQIELSSGIVVRRCSLFSERELRLREVITYQKF